MTDVNKQAENRLRHYEDCAGAIDQLFRSAISNKEPDAFTKFLDFANSFNNLSVYNSMLVRVQKPGATMVGTRDQWREIERQVLADAVPIIILWPFGPVRFVFELADTTGKELPGREDNPLFVRGELPKNIIEGKQRRIKIGDLVEFELRRWHNEHETHPKHGLLNWIPIYQAVQYSPYVDFIEQTGEIKIQEPGLIKSKDTAF